ncbi:MAG: cytochrome C554 [Calditrichaeota bacterium]|nr:cytochrome C554 [Calditrichota bacterium]
MKRYAVVVALIALIGLWLAPTAPVKAEEKQYKYVGVGGCKTCHKTKKSGNQYGIWLETKHAKAYETLKSEEAAKIAKEKGLDKPAYESPQCLKCHVTAYDVEPARLGKKYKKEDGVQCESCHGPGSAYKKKKIMKDRELAIANGLNPILVEDGTAEKLCKTCHNEESPTFKGFNFKERWEEIKHPVPPKQ